MNPRLFTAALLALAASGLPAQINPLNGTALPRQARGDRSTGKRTATDADRERIAAAEAKRARKAERRKA